MQEGKYFRKDFSVYFKIESDPDHFFALSCTRAKLLEYLEKDIGYILPSLGSKCITDGYLQGVLKGKFLIFKEMKNPPFVKFCNKHELFLELEKICKLCNENKEEKDRILLGFDELLMPNKKWIAAALYELNPENDIFLKGKHLIDIEFLDKLSKRSIFLF